MTLEAFLPPSLRRYPLPAELPAAMVRSETLLYSDISGFTALTERLQAQGREGAEEIASLVSRAFAPAIDAIAAHGGSVESFGGDALLASFAGGPSPARAAAEAIQGAFRRARLSTSAGAVKLEISQAIHAGRVLAVHLGTPGRRHYLLAGRAVQYLARLEERAEPGAIVISRAARAHAARPTRATAPAATSPTAALHAYLPPRLRKLLKGHVGAYRPVSVLFLEVAGAALGSLQEFHDALGDALDRYDGVLLKSDLSPLGTKWLCVFGIPAAHEEDADRAVRAGRDVLEALGRRVQVRGGMHAGTVANVLVGTARRRSLEVMGDVVNTSARIASLARWGEIAVSEATAASLSDAVTEPRGTHRVKGKREPLRLHAVLRSAIRVRRIRVSAAMVGRDEELHRIEEALRQARDGTGCVLGVRGEAGLGKSRLKLEGAARARALGFAVHEGRSVAVGGTLYGTVAALLRHALSLPDVPSRAETWQAVDREAARLGLSATDRNHLDDVLGARRPASPLAHLRPEDVRLNNAMAVESFWSAASQGQPRLLVMEDMHWSDGASKGVAAWLARAAPRLPLVLLLLYRPGYQPPAGTEELRLAELPGELVDRLLHAHLGPLPPPVRSLVRERSSGNPFYVEELSRHLLEGGYLVPGDGGHRLVREPAPDDLPATVEAIIAARLDRLGTPARAAAERGAVLGRTFLYAILEGLGRRSDRVRAAVDELASREIIFEKAQEPRLQYIFKHALTRDVAYGAILARRRRRLHARAAEAIERLFPEERDMFLAMLGHHYERAGRGKLARACFLEAARDAVKRHALDEAERMFGSYLAHATGDAPERVDVENELGSEVHRMRGEMEEAVARHRRAAAMAHRLDDRAAEARSKRLLAMTLLAAGRPDEARATAEEALALARACGARRVEAGCLGELGLLLWQQGRYEEGRPHYEQARDAHRAAGDRKGEAIWVGNLGVLLVERGDYEEARDLLHDALTMAREAGDRRHEGVWLGNLGILDQEQGRLADARARYAEALAVAVEVGDRRAELVWRLNLAMLHDAAWDAGAAIDTMRACLASARNMAQRRIEAHVLYNLGTNLLERGELEEADASIQDGLAIARELSDRRMEGICLSASINIGILRHGSGRLLDEEAARAEALLAGVRGAAALDLIALLGHLALDAGRSAEEHLGRLRVLAGDLGIQGGSARSPAIDRLARAQAAFAVGDPLVCGHCPDDVSPGIVAWLRTHRPGALGPAGSDGGKRPA